MSEPDQMGDLGVMVKLWEELRARSFALQLEARELCIASKELRASNALLRDDLRVIRSSTTYVHVRAMRKRSPSPKKSD